MGKRKLELQTGYIADAIMQTKKKKFNEEYTTIEEVDIIKQVIQKRIQQRNLKVKIVDGYFERYFDIINGVITKADKETISLKQYISDMEIGDTIYDEQFIYLCLCEIIADKLNNSIEHSCYTCNSYCCGGLPPEQAKDCSKWTHDFKKHKVIKKTLEI